MHEQERAHGREANPPVVRAWRDAWLYPVLDGAGLLEPGDLTRLRETGAGSLWAACLQAGLLEDDVIARAVATRFRLPLADVDRIPASAPAACLRGEVAVRLGIIPLGIDGRFLDLAGSDPTDLTVEQAAAFGSGCRVRMHIASPAAIARALARAYPGIAPGSAHAARSRPADADPLSAAATAVAAERWAREHARGTPLAEAQAAAPPAPQPAPAGDDYREFDAFVAALARECEEQLDARPEPAPRPAPARPEPAPGSAPGTAPGTAPAKVARGPGRTVPAGPRGSARPPILDRRRRSPDPFRTAW